MLFLLPVYIVLAVVTRAWASLATLGTKLASAFGLKSIMGVGASTVLSGVSLVVLWFICGLLAEISLVAAFRRRIEGWFATYIPGYAIYRSMVEDKLQAHVRTLPYTAVLVRSNEGWRPGYAVEIDADGLCVVYVPEAPDTSRGSVLLAGPKDLRALSDLSVSDLDAALKRRVRDF